MTKFISAAPALRLVTPVVAKKIVELTLALFQRDLEVALLSASPVADGLSPGGASIDSRRKPSRDDMARPGNKALLAAIEKRTGIAQHQGTTFADAPITAAMLKESPELQAFVNAVLPLAEAAGPDYQTDGAYQLSRDVGAPTASELREIASKIAMVSGAASKAQPPSRSCALLIERTIAALTVVSVTPDPARVVLPNVLNGRRGVAANQTDVFDHLLGGRSQAPSKSETAARQYAGGLCTTVDALLTTEFDAALGAAQYEFTASMRKKLAANSVVDSNTEREEHADALEKAFSDEWVRDLLADMLPEPGIRRSGPYSLAQ